MEAIEKHRQAKYGEEEMKKRETEEKDQAREETKLREADEAGGQGR